MNTWTHRFSTTALTAALVLGTTSLSAAPALAAPSPSSSCTGQSASAGAQNENLHPFGKSTVSRTAKSFTEDDDPRTNFGQTVIVPEAQDDDCDD